MLDMEPVIAPLVAEEGLGLGDLVRVMREGIVDAAAVDIQIFTEVLDADARALDVPAGIADAPRGIPLEGLILACWSPPRRPHARRRQGPPPYGR